MDPSETHNFEDQWKKALNEASETPPPSVWEGIEAHLDREDDDIIPLWWRSPKLWYAAASIAALLLVGGGIWYNNSLKNIHSGNQYSGITKDQDKTGIATKAPFDHSSKTEISENKTEKKDQEKDVNEPLIANNSNTADSDKNEKTDITDSNKNNVFLTEKNKNNAAGNVVEKSNSNRSEIPAIKEDQNVIAAKTEKQNQDSQKVNVENGTSSNAPAIAFSEPIKSNSSEQSRQDDELNNMKNTSVAADLLTPIPYSDLDVFMQKRYVFFKPESKPEEKLAEHKKPKEYWAGVNLMPASFNPDVKISSAPTAFSSQLASRQKALTGTNKPGASYAVQTQGGVRLSKHWSLETGLSYLQGNSKYEGGGYILGSSNNTASNVLQDALSSLAYSSSKNADMVSSPAAPNGFANVTNNSLYIDVNKNVSNNYQFLQLPVQAGFTLNADKKLSYSVLGGMMANFFLNNQLEAATGEIITTTASDDVYRSLNWAATTGLRFNYKLSAKWKASLTGSYQKAITSGFRANQSLESHPYLYGVSWGFRYSF